MYHRTYGHFSTGKIDWQAWKCIFSQKCMLSTWWCFINTLWWNTFNIGIIVFLSCGHWPQLIVTIIPILICLENGKVETIKHHVIWSNNMQNGTKKLLAESVKMKPFSLFYFFIEYAILLMTYWTLLYIIII